MMFLLQMLSGEQSLDLRSWPFCVVPVVLWRGCFVCPIYILYLCTPGCIEQHKLHYSVYACVLPLRREKFLPQLVGRFEVNRDMMPLKILQSVSDVSTT